MRCYDPEQPLVSLHVPKCAGTSFRKVLEQWFGDQLRLHYIRRGERPPQQILEPGSCIHGHFREERGTGIQQYYPDAKQFLTILRDPAEVTLSRYFFHHHRAQQGIAPRYYQLPASAEEALEADTSPYLPFLPWALTPDNFAEVLERDCVYVGVTERLNRCMQQLAAIVGKKPVNVPVLNQAPRDQKVSARAYQRFRDNHPLEYAIYHWALERVESGR